MRMGRVVLVIGLVALMASPLLAGPKKERKEQPRKPHKSTVESQIARMLEGITLTEDQKKQVSEIEREMGPKLTEVFAKLDSVLTEEQKKARAEAAKAAKAAGKKDKEFKQAVEEAVKLTEEQKAKMAELRKQAGELTKALREKIVSILTEEQKAQLKKGKEHKKTGK